jgi:hypothetical protein
MPHSLQLSLTALLFAVSGCASTITSQLTPSPQAPVCQGTSKALIIWATQLRPDQKDTLAREAAASDGIGQFFQKSGCFSSVSVRRLQQYSTPAIEAAVADASGRYEKVVLVVVRELGPTFKIGASLALVEGGTEVVLEISEYMPASTVPRTFAVQWRSGGPGVLKGVATLPQDMQSALASGLQPATR